MALDINQLNCFVAVAEELHFGRAAVRLCMTQPPLSRQIQLLEQTLGVQLLERNNRHVRLTAAGRIFLPDALRILHLTEQATITARRASTGEVGRIVIGFTSVTGVELMPQLVVAARKVLPHIDIILKEMVSIEQIHELEANTIDLGFMRSLPARENLTRERIASEKLIAALPMDHPLTEKTVIQLEDLHGLPFITYTPTAGNYLYTLISTLLNERGIVPDYIQHIDESHTILGLVRAGLGVSIVPESVAILYTDSVAYRPLGHEAILAETSMIWRADSNNPALATFRDFASRHFASLRTLAENTQMQHGN